MSRTQAGGSSVFLCQFLDAIGSLSSYPCQSVGQWVIDSFRFGDSYRISELCEFVSFSFLYGI